jgi:hypothetical protein
MIKANQLRIGNLFFDEDNTPCYFAGAWQRQDGWICRDSANNTYKEMQLYPIPLTHEILEQCGFVKMEVIKETYKLYDLETITDVYELGDLIDRGYFEVRITNNSHDKDVSILANGKPVKCLHQLQNLYFALKDEELTVNL